jgi:branched-chain amino acid transport system substrate-binding protein
MAFALGGGSVTSKRWSACIAVLLAGAFLNCGRGSGSIKIGGLTPLTGEGAGYGASTRNGYELAVREWNDRGGVLGRRLELALRDDQGSPAEGLAALTKLIEYDRIVALLGPTLSKVSLVAAPIVQSVGIPMVSPTASDPRLTALGDHIYRICCTDRAQGDAAASFAFHELRARKAACMGGEQVAFLNHPNGSPATTALISRAVRARPDILFIPDYGADAALIAREARAQGFKGALLGGDGWDGSVAGLESGYFTSNFSKDEPRPSVQDFVRKYRERYRSEPDACAALAYDAGNVLFEAILRAGTTGGPALAAALAGTDHAGVSGRIRFDPQRNPVKSPLILEIRDGRRICRSVRSAS